MSHPLTAKGKNMKESSDDVLPSILRSGEIVIPSTGSGSATICPHCKEPLPAPPSEDFKFCPHCECRIYMVPNTMKCSSCGSVGIIGKWGEFCDQCTIGFGLVSLAIHVSDPVVKKALDEAGSEIISQMLKKAELQVTD